MEVVVGVWWRIGMWQGIAEYDDEAVDAPNGGGYARLWRVRLVAGGSVDGMG